MRIFINFASNDVFLAEKMEFYILGIGHEVWKQEYRVDSQRDSDSRVEQQLKDADVVVSLLTQNSLNTSDFRELYWPTAREKKNLLLVRYENVEFPILDVPRIDFTQDEKKGLKDLREYLERIELIRDSEIGRWFFTRDRVSERDMISEAVSEVYFVQETGASVAESCFPQIISLLQKGIKIQVLMPNPMDAVLIKLLAFRNVLNVEAYPARYNNSRNLWRNALGSVTSQNIPNLEFYRIDYPLSFTGVFVDHLHQNPEQRTALIRLPGFKTYYPDKLTFTLRASKSPFAFDSFCQELERLLERSEKFDFLGSA